MADSNLAKELKYLRFSPGRGVSNPKRYPFKIPCEVVKIYDLKAKVMGFKAGEKELVERLTLEMRDARWSSDDIDRHPTHKMFQNALPPMARSDRRNGSRIFTHYDRIGWFRSGGFRKPSHMLAMAHLRHVAIIDDEIQYRIGEPWNGAAIYQLQILNVWDRLQGDGHLENAIVQRVLDYVGQIGSAAINVRDSALGDDFHYHFAPVPVIVEIQQPFFADDIIDLAAIVASRLARFTDDRSEAFTSMEDEGFYLAAVLLKPMAPSDEDEIDSLT